MEKRFDVEGQQYRVQYSFWKKVTQLPTNFKYEDLEKATNKFTAVIGKGSSGVVFKGILDGGTSVAVKQIDSEHGDREFKVEAAIIAGIHHNNLIHLIGYCVPLSRPRYLIYEFIQNGSLDNWIFPSKDSADASTHRKCLSWALRLNVAKDVAKALAYLHHGCRHRVLHLDVKPENILLDDTFRAVVTDFGMSKLMSRDESRVITSVRGTRGYLAPEWMIGAGVATKCDVYSYGMVLMELVGGRRNIQNVYGEEGKKTYSYFPKIAAEKAKQHREIELVDERLTSTKSEGIDEREVSKAVRVALWCVQEKAEMRPSMEQVVEMLEGREPVEMPPDTKMIMVDLLGINDDPDRKACHNTERDKHLRLLQLNSLERPIKSHVCSYEYELSSLHGR
ncbi:hypothetical protein LUZ60_008305 [Juncus effusus]|nr:hypothetical protein LUZ60_008305 [Juncus effusus]